MPRSSHLAVRLLHDIMIVWKVAEYHHQVASRLQQSCCGRGWLNSRHYRIRSTPRMAWKSIMRRTGMSIQTQGHLRRTRKAFCEAYTTRQSYEWKSKTQELALVTKTRGEARCSRPMWLVTLMPAPIYELTCVCYVTSKLRLAGARAGRGKFTQC
jgi:hypothetical protein